MDHSTYTARFGKQSAFVLLGLLFLKLTACSPKAVNYEKIATYQDPKVPEEQFVVSDSTRVLLIFPHSDDEIVAAGLVTGFREKGATIHLLTLSHPPSEEKNATRLQELNCSVEKLGIASLEVAGLPNNSWDRVMEDDILFWYDHQDSIRSVIQAKIDRFQPHILITYDSEIGGYGHPEHRISAELAEAIFLGQTGTSNLEKLYQITLPDALEKFVVSASPAYKKSLQRTGSKGLPPADIAVNLGRFWTRKNEAAHCHVSQARTLRKFYMMYQAESEAAHRKAFSREYYRLLER